MPDIVPITDQLFTVVNIGSVGIATGAVNLVSNTFYKLGKLPKKWTGFITALVIAYLVVFISTNSQWYDWIFAFLNACLLFCAAVGVNEIGNVVENPPGGPKFMKTEGFFSPWFKRAKEDVSK